MNTCWKCGEPVGEGQTECEYGCGNKNDVRQMLDYMERQMFERHQNARTLDWNKVNTLEDLKLILSTIFEHVEIDQRAPVFQKLKKFCADKPNQP